MTPKEASTTKARKTDTEHAASPQIVRIVTSEERNASMEAGICHVTPEASRPFLSWIYAKHNGSTTDDHKIAS